MHGWEAHEAAVVDLEHMDPHGTKRMRFDIESGRQHDEGLRGRAFRVQT